MIKNFKKFTEIENYSKSIVRNIGAAFKNRGPIRGECIKYYTVMSTKL